MIRGNSIAAVCLFLLWGLAACGAGEVLNVPLKDAEERLLKGDVDFILAADVSRLNELERFNAPALFYSGLLASESSPSHGAALFTLALGSPSPLIREASAQKLIPLVLEGPDTALAERVRKRFQGRDRVPAESGSALKALEQAASFALGRYAAVSKPAEGASPWERVLYLAARLALAPKEGDAAAKALEGAADELAGILFTAPAGDIDRWVFAQGAARGGVSPVSGFPERFGAAEYAALAGRLAVARSAYQEGLIQFKGIFEEGRELFFHYPELLGDLGRAFQFGAAGEEGLALFSEWDGLLDARTDIPPGVLGPVRYRLRYFAGRIERQRRQYAEAEALFTRALEAAPDAIQEDASMWYILDTAISRNGARRDSFERELLPLLQRFAPRWHDPFYFEDVLDRLSRLLVAGRQWKALAGVFALLRGDAGGGIAAQYAYILGRAIETGLLSSAGIGPAAEFFKFARDRASGALYYRALAASRLGTALVPFPLESGEAAGPASPEGSGEVPALAEFILGFFRFGAGRFAYSYLRDAARDAARELSAADLRALAGAFHQDGRWAEAMRVAAAYLYRPGYTPARQDMEIFYPRAFADLVEPAARESNIQAALFYGLIRTESSFEADVRSRAGAAGLTQLMPATAGEMAGRLSRRGGPNYAAGGEPDLLNPEVNIRLGAFYLRYLVDYMENPLLAVLAYNGGMGRVRRWRTAESRLPADLFLETVEYPETRDYGRKVFSSAAAYGYLYYALPLEAAFAGILK
ncbi:MAG: lytic transglycosylase domain-containing protein [Treponema sp.]|jgi:soluble lytic murein transglycosylase|nr:lytic transglycosylase domain-containing protein [Treponema sp.]